MLRSGGILIAVSHPIVAAGKLVSSIPFAKSFLDPLVRLQVPDSEMELHREPAKSFWLSNVFGIARKLIKIWARRSGESFKFIKASTLSKASAYNSIACRANSNPPRHRNFLCYFEGGGHYQYPEKT